MNEITVPFPWQLAGGFLTLINVILALYIFVLNPRRQANRLVSLATALLGVISVGVIYRSGQIHMQEGYQHCLSWLQLCQPQDQR